MERPSVFKWHLKRKQAKEEGKEATRPREISRLPSAAFMLAVENPMSPSGCLWGRKRPHTPGGVCFLRPSLPCLRPHRPTAPGWILQREALCCSPHRAFPWTAWMHLPNRPSLAAFQHRRYQVNITLLLTLSALCPSRWAASHDDGEGFASIRWCTALSEFVACTQFPPVSFPLILLRLRLRHLFYPSCPPPAPTYKTCSEQRSNFSYTYLHALK